MIPQTRDIRRWCYMETPNFVRGDAVVYRPSREGGTIKESFRSGGETWYVVRFGKRTMKVVEHDLDPEEEIGDVLALVRAGKWGTLQSFRAALTFERLQHTNQNTLYTFKSERILFQPHQYKPLLRFLESSDRRLLIADEVGLGKTIEAGLILKELEARFHPGLDKVLVVCPSRLRDKWREELNRKFDQNFEIFDRSRLEEYLKQLAENPRRGRLRAIISMATLRADGIRTRLAAELDPIDLVIIDEAHHARNRVTKTHGLLTELCRVGEAILLLSATPVQLDLSNLFALLQPLRPEDFRSEGQFIRELNSHQKVLRAGALIRQQDANLLSQARNLLADVFPPGRDQDPLARDVLADLMNPPEDRAAWVNAERRVQDLHYLSGVMTRTRKRDVDVERPQRRPLDQVCTWSEEEQEAYRGLVGISNGLGWLRGDLSLGQIQRARQAASCLPAALEMNSVVVTDDEQAEELTDIPPSEIDATNQTGVSTTFLPALTHDSKFLKFREILAQISKDEPSAKVLVFTFFKGTARYLARELERLGFAALYISGDVPSNPRNPARDERGQRIREFKENPKVQVLVSTEVGSEGLDFQFCHHLINYDLPWNPMVLEQRIGRIDRFGQEAKVLHIVNLYVAGTVEDRILRRLYDRIKLFESSVGDLEAILGGVVNQLLRDYLSGNLTPEEAEARVDQEARAIENRKADLENLEKQAADLLGFEEYLQTQLNQLSRLGRHLSETALLALIETYLKSYHPQVQIWEETSPPTAAPGARVFGLMMTDELLMSIHQACQRSQPQGPYWNSRRPGQPWRFCFNGDQAWVHSNLELINPPHPFVKAALTSLATQLDSPQARVGKASLVLNEGENFGAGVFVLFVFVHEITGFRARRLFDVVAFRLQDNGMVDSEASERLLHLVIENGVEWHESAEQPIPGEGFLDRSVAQSLLRNKNLDVREQSESRARVLRRRGSLEAQFRDKIENLERKAEQHRQDGQNRAVALVESQIDKQKARFLTEKRKLDDQDRNCGVRTEGPIAACLIEVRYANRLQA